MKTILIAAMTENGRIIGKEGKLPWHLPEDLANFRKVTLGKPVVMGRKTFESLPEKFRPLPGRKNVVISRSGTGHSGSFWVTAPEEALSLLKKENEDSVFVIWWAEIYRNFLEKDLADEVWISLVEGEYDGDARFPPFEDCFKAYETTPFESFKFVKYRRHS